MAGKRIKILKKEKKNTLCLKIEGECEYHSIPGKTTNCHLY